MTAGGEGVVPTAAMQTGRVSRVSAYNYISTGTRPIRTRISGTEKV